jgi:hypothetical protein
MNLKTIIISACLVMVVYGSVVGYYIGFKTSYSSSDEVYIDVPSGEALPLIVVKILTPGLKVYGFYLKKSICCKYSRGGDDDSQLDIGSGIIVYNAQ